MNVEGREVWGGGMNKSFLPTPRKVLPTFQTYCLPLERLDPLTPFPPTSGRTMVRGIPFSCSVAATGWLVGQQEQSAP